MSVFITQQVHEGASEDQIWRVFKDGQNAKIMFQHIAKNTFHVMRSGKHVRTVTGYGAARNVALDLAGRKRDE